MEMNDSDDDDDVDWEGEDEDDDEEVIKYDGKDSSIRITLDSNDSKQASDEKDLPIQGRKSGRRSVKINFDADDYDTCFERHQNDILNQLSSLQEAATAASSPTIIALVASIVPSELTNRGAFNTSVDHIVALIRWIHQTFHFLSLSDVTLDEGYRVRYVRTVDPVPLAPARHPDIYERQWQAAKAIATAATTSAYTYNANGNDLTNDAAVTASGSRLVGKRRTVKRATAVPRLVTCVEVLLEDATTTSTTTSTDKSTAAIDAPTSSKRSSSASVSAASATSVPESTSITTDINNGRHFLTAANATSSSSSSSSSRCSSCAGNTGNSVVAQIVDLTSQSDGVQNTNNNNVINNNSKEEPIVVDGDEACENLLKGVRAKETECTNKMVVQKKQHQRHHQQWRQQRWVHVDVARRRIDEPWCTEDLVRNQLSLQPQQAVVLQVAKPKIAQAGMRSISNSINSATMNGAQSSDASMPLPPPPAPPAPPPPRQRRLPSQAPLQYVIGAEILPPIAGAAIGVATGVATGFATGVATGRCRLVLRDVTSTYKRRFTHTPARELKLKQEVEIWLHGVLVQLSADSLDPRERVTTFVPHTTSSITSITSSSGSSSSPCTAAAISSTTSDSREQQPPVVVDLTEGVASTQNESTQAQVIEEEEEEEEEEEVSKSYDIGEVECSDSLRNKRRSGIAGRKRGRSSADIYTTKEGSDARMHQSRQYVSLLDEDTVDGGDVVANAAHYLSQDRTAKLPDGYSFIPKEQQEGEDEVRQEEAEEGDVQDVVNAYPLPSRVADFKNHPVYLLQRHLLLEEAIRPIRIRTRKPFVPPPTLPLSNAVLAAGTSSSQAEEQEQEQLVLRTTSYDGNRMAGSGESSAPVLIAVPPSAPDERTHVNIDQISSKCVPLTGNSNSGSTGNHGYDGDTLSDGMEYRYLPRPPVALFRGEQVFLQRHKEKLRTKLQWRRAKRQVIGSNCGSSTSSSASSSSASSCSSSSSTGSSSNGANSSSASSSSAISCSSRNGANSSNGAHVDGKEVNAVVQQQQQQPIRVLLKRRRLSSSSSNMSGDADTYEVKLYGSWQTEEIHVEPVRILAGGLGGQKEIPVNNYGNVEVWEGNTSFVPAGATFISTCTSSTVALPAADYHAFGRSNYAHDHTVSSSSNGQQAAQRILKAARGLGIPCVPAVTGFERRGPQGLNTPVIGGVVVLSEHADLVQDASLYVDSMKQEQIFVKREKALIGKWEKIVYSILSRENLRIKYGH